MGVLVMADPASKVTYNFSDATQAEIAIGTYGYIPLLDDGSQAQVVAFEGAHLVQGAPLNAWIGGVWYEGQKDIVAGLIQSGQVKQPPARIWNLPVTQAPADVLANYAAYKGTTGSSLLEIFQKFGGPGAAGVSSWVWIALAGAAALFLIPRRGKKTASGGAQDGL